MKKLIVGLFLITLLATSAQASTRKHHAYSEDFLTKQHTDHGKKKHGDHRCACEKKQCSFSWKSALKGISEDNQKKIKDKIKSLKKETHPLEKKLAEVKAFLHYQTLKEPLDKKKISESIEKIESIKSDIMKKKVNAFFSIKNSINEKLPISLSEFLHSKEKRHKKGRSKWQSFKKRMHKKLDRVSEEKQEKIMSIRKTYVDNKLVDQLKEKKAYLHYLTKKVEIEKNEILKTLDDIKSLNIKAKANKIFMRQEIKKELKSH